MAAKKAGGEPALRVERPCPPLDAGTAPPALPAEQWKTWTWRDYYEDARKAGKGAGVGGLVCKEAMRKVSRMI